MSMCMSMNIELINCWLRLRIGMEKLKVINAYMVYVSFQMKLNLNIVTCHRHMNWNFIKIRIHRSILCIWRISSWKRKVLKTSSWIAITNSFKTTEMLNLSNLPNHFQNIDFPTILYLTWYSHFRSISDLI